MPYPHDLSARALFAPKTVVAPLLSAAPADYFSSAHPYPFGRAAAGYLLKKHAKKRAFGSQWGRRYVRIDRHSGTLVYGRRADDAPTAVLPLADCTAVQLGSKEFAIRCPYIPEDSGLVLACESNAEAARWLRCLDACISWRRSMREAEGEADELSRASTSRPSTTASSTASSATSSAASAAVRSRRNSRDASRPPSAGLACGGTWATAAGVGAGSAAPGADRGGGGAGQGDSEVWSLDDVESADGRVDGEFEMHI